MSLTLNVTWCWFPSYWLGRVTGITQQLLNDCRTDVSEVTSGDWWKRIKGKDVQQLASWKAHLYEDINFWDSKKHSTCLKNQFATVQQTCIQNVVLVNLFTSIKPLWMIVPASSLWFLLIIRDDMHWKMVLLCFSFFCLVICSLQLHQHQVGIITAADLNNQ